MIKFLTVFKEIKRCCGISNKLFYGIISMVFVAINYSQSSWKFFNKYGGLPAAKIMPEIIGIFFFALLSVLYIRNFYKNFRIKISKQDWYGIIFLFITIFVFRFKQFSTYFWKDDFYLFLNRIGGGYSFFTWGPWLSSFPAWTWEVIRHFFDYSIIPYQFSILLLHFLFAVGVFLLTKYISKNNYIGLMAAFFVSTTTISFEAFEYYMNPINIAWQAFLVCLSVVACVWEIRKKGGTNIPYLSAFLILPAFMSGIARVGFILPFMSIVIFLVSVEFFNPKKIFIWLKNLLLNQIPYYLPIVLFLTIRGLWQIRNIKTEVTTASFYRIYLYMIGISSVPVEFYISLSRWTNSTINPGTLTVYMGFLFLALFLFYCLFTKLRRKKIPLTLSIGFFWLTTSILFYVLFAPHLPSTDREIDIATRTHHLSYVACAGAIMIWSYIFYQIIAFVDKIKRPFGRIVIGLIILGSITLSYKLINDRYTFFLDFAKGVSVTRQQFFFDSYRKHIPVNANNINIFYDDGYSKRKDNYRPSEYYFAAFWNFSKIRIFWGDNELKLYLDGLADSQKNDFMDNLYAIFTDYDDGAIEQDLSTVLKEQIRNPKTQAIFLKDWGLYWGKTIDNLFVPEIITDDINKLTYFKNPTLTLTDLNFPAVFTPRLNIKLNTTINKGQMNFIDLRAGILSNILTHWDLPDASGLDSLAQYYSVVSSKSFSDLSNILSNANVNEKMVCEKQLTNNGISLFIIWIGEPDSFYSKLSPIDKKDFFSTKHNQRFYSICHFSQVQGIKNISLDLANTGSMIRGLVVVPLSLVPVNIEVLDSYLQSPKILK